MSIKTLLSVLALIFFEWLDFSLYLYLAKTVFADHFFPDSPSSLALSFLLFSAAYMARPLGGWLFGRAADGTGRRSPLILSAALMGISTLCIAMLPDYSSIGVFSTWGLLFCRIGQGLALGGEINNSAMYLIEHHANRPLLTGSFVAASGALGMFFGGAIAALLQLQADTELWRLVFILIGGLSLLLCQIRKGLLESPEFKADRTSARYILSTEYTGILNIAVVALYVSVTVYLCNGFWVFYASDQGFWPKAASAWAGSIAQLLSALLAVPIAWFVRKDRVRALLRASMFTALLGMPLLFYFTSQANSVGVYFGLACYVLANGLLCSSLFYFLYLQLPAAYRCRGVSTAWALAATLGAFSLPVAEQAYQLGWSWAAPLGVAVVALLGLWRISPVNKRPVPSMVS